VHEGQAQFLFQHPGMGIGIVEGFAFEHHLAADAFGLHHLHRGGGARHDDGDRHAQPGAVVRQALRMVPRRGRNHAARALFIIEQQQSIERTALLVSSGELQVFKLQPDIRAGNFRQGDRMHHRGFDHRAINPRGGGADIVNGKVGRAGGGTFGAG